MRQMEITFPNHIFYEILYMGSQMYTLKGGMGSQLKIFNVKFQHFSKGWPRHVVYQYVVYDP